MPDTTPRNPKGDKDMRAAKKIVAKAEPRRPAPSKGRGIFPLPQDHDPYDPKNADSGGFGMGGTSGSSGGFGVGGVGPQTGSYGSQANYGRGKTPGGPDSKPLTGPASQVAERARAARKK